MANRWWAAHMGLPGGQQTPSSKLETPTNPPPSDHNPTDDPDDDLDNNNSDDVDPREGAVEAGSRRPRGRPPGSKNKPKPPIFLTRDSPSSLRSHVMEVAAGSDLADSIATFARRRQQG